MDALHVTGYCPIEKVRSQTMLTGRKGAAVVSDGAALYIIGGEDAFGTMVETIERFDVRTGKSLVVGKLKEPRVFHAAVLLGRKIYVLGGKPKWSTAGSASGGIPESFNKDVRPTGPLPPPRPSNPVSRERYLDSLEIIDLDSGAHSFGRRLPVPKANFGCVVYDGKLWVIGGKKMAGGSFASTNTVEIYDPATNRWEKGLPMPTPRQCAAVAVGDLILVPGGYDGRVKRAEFEFFSPKEKAWKKLPDLPARISATALTQLGKYLFFFGDYDHQDQIFAYNLERRQGEAFTAGFTPARHAAAIVHADEIFVVGGATTPNETALDRIEVFALRKR